MKFTFARQINRHATCNYLKATQVPFILFSFLFYGGKVQKLETHLQRCGNVQQADTA